MTWKDLEKELKRRADPVRAKHSQRYFKTGKGEYGEGDVFLGMTTAVMVNAALKFKDLPLPDLAQLLSSEYHECRASALVILKMQYLKAESAGRKKIFDFYLKNTGGINNWDLVDISAPNILGDWLLDKDRTILYKLAKSKNLWGKRMAVMATFAFIRAGELDDSLKIAEMLLGDVHDLIHKAVGWMLREIGKRDMAVEEKFLQKHVSQMPRTMLRYAIEKFPEKKRKLYLG
jgi:3-methyladenine DNA glycosylase AlkD